MRDVSKDQEVMSKMIADSQLRCVEGMTAAVMVFEFHYNGECIVSRFLGDVNRLVILGAMQVHQSKIEHEVLGGIESRQID